MNGSRYHECGRQSSGLTRSSVLPIVAALDRAMCARGVRKRERLPNDGSQPAARRKLERFTQRSAEVLSTRPQTANQRDPATHRDCFIDIRERAAGHAERTEARRAGVGVIRIELSICQHGLCSPMPHAERKRPGTQR